MKSVTYRSVLLAVLMITSSLAGCLGDGADDADDTDNADDADDVGTPPAGMEAPGGVTVV